MTHFTKYDSIPQFRNALQCMQHLGIDAITYIGSVKLHGCNSAINYNQMGITCQSRNREITIEDDNYEFAKFVDELPVDELESIVPDKYHTMKNVVVYGEFCGIGIQKKVGIASLPRMFVIFDVTVDGKYLSSEDVIQFGCNMQEYNIHNIYDFTTFIHTITRDKALESQAFFADCVKVVEDLCPVADALCADDDRECMIGEGIVWKPVVVELRQITGLCFKTKGAKHSASKVRSVAQISPEMLAKDNTVAEFIAKVVTENRLLQGVQYLQEMKVSLESKSTGEFLKWVGQDVWKEEKDLAEANGLERKDFGGRLNQKAKTWWFAYLNDGVGL